MRDADRIDRTWNHRVVRRYKEVAPHMREALGTDEQVWLEITEVHYADGVPNCFALDLSKPMSGGDGESDEERLKGLRWTLERMLKALDQPILDEKKDFPEET
jgi:hypothetical protein